MGFDKLIGFAFNIFFVVMLLLIIFYSLKIMSKDVEGKSKTKKRQQPSTDKKARVKQAKQTKQTKQVKQTKQTTVDNKSYGLEVMATLTEGKLRVGTVIPMVNVMTLGRKEDNSIILNDKFVSSNHAKIYLKGDQIILEDLNSTNGSFVNEERVVGRIRIGINDTVRLGSTVFKVIG